MKRLRSAVVAGLLPLIAMAPVAGFAQDAGPPPTAQPAPPPAAQPAPPPADAGAPAAAPAEQAAPAFSTAQLDQMLAPIALYPDNLLMQILMASTYPVQIVEAERWLQVPKNAALHGDALVAALQPLPWDPSVKSLIPFPQLVKQMNDQLDWTQSMGTAFANQQAEVMDRLQALRQKCEANGKLASSAQLRVVHQGPQIVIEPADPAVVYVPVYNPVEVYGPWPYVDYPPFYFAPAPGFFVGAVGIGIGFSVGFGIVDPLWGWGHPVWGERNIYINNARYSQISYNHTGFAGATWRHAGPVGRIAAGSRAPVSGRFAAGASARGFAGAAAPRGAGARGFGNAAARGAATRSFNHTAGRGIGSTGRAARSNASFGSHRSGPGAAPHAATRSFANHASSFSHAPRASAAHFAPRASAGHASRGSAGPGNNRHGH